MALCVYKQNIKKINMLSNWFLFSSFSFSYGDEENDCGSDFATVIKNFILDPDEYVTQVSGRSNLNINKVNQDLFFLIKPALYIYVLTLR